MHCAATCLTLALGAILSAADVESRVLTHYVPQDFLETVVRTEAWTELPLNVKGGVRKGDVVRIWTGGSIDRGNGDQPAQYVSGPSGPETPPAPNEVAALAIASEARLAFALLFKSETVPATKPPPPGKPLEIKLSKDKERLWISFNDLRGRYRDNHLGKGRRHEFDPLWIRVEVVRIIVD